MVPLIVTLGGAPLAASRASSKLLLHLSVNIKSECSTWPISIRVSTGVAAHEERSRANLAARRRRECRYLRFGVAHRVEARRRVGRPYREAAHSRSVTPVPLKSRTQPFSRLYVARTSSQTTLRVLQILTTVEVSAIVRAGRCHRRPPSVDRGKAGRVRPETGAADPPDAAGDRRGRPAGCRQRVRGRAVFYPVYQRAERIQRRWSSAASAVSYAGGQEQPIEVLQLCEVRFTRSPIAHRHLPVVSDHSPRKNRLIVHPDEGQQLSSVGPEPVRAVLPSP